MNEILDFIIQSLDNLEGDKPYIFNSKTNKWNSIKIGNKTLLKVETGKSVTIYDAVEDRNICYKSTEILKIVKDNINIIKNTYTLFMLESDDDMFGCCSSYMECSNQKKCIKDNDFSRNCYYRKNLEIGKIFYGKNRNID